MTATLRQSQEKHTGEQLHMAENSCNAFFPVPRMVYFPLLCSQFKGLASESLIYVSPGCPEKTLSSEHFSLFSKVVLDNQNSGQTSV